MPSKLEACRRSRCLDDDVPEALGNIRLVHCRHSCQPQKLPLMGVPSHDPQLRAGQRKDSRGQLTEPAGSDDEDPIGGTDVHLLQDLHGCR